MLGDWVVGVFLRFSTNGTATMSRLASSANAANAALLRQQGLITKNEAAMLRYQRRMEELRLSQIRFATTTSAMFAGVGLAGIAASVRSAGELQRTLLGIQNVTGAKGSGAFYNQAFNLGNQFGMSPEQAAEIMRTTVRMSVGQLSQQQMLKVAPTITEFAMLMNQNRGMSLDKAAEVGISLAHMFRAYTPDALKKMIDMNLRMSEMMGESPEAAQRQMAYYMPLFKGLNVSDDASMGMMALLSRAGFRNKVGTNVRAFLLETLGPLQLTQHAQNGKNAMLHAMGITDASGNIEGRFTKGGKYDMFGVLYQMASWEKSQLASGKTLGDIYKVLYGTFGKQGGTIAALFSDPQMVKFLGSIRGYLNNPAVSMEEQARRTQTGFLFQAGRAGHNVAAVATELAYPWLNKLADSAGKLADAAHGFQQWLHQHPTQEKQIGGGLAWLTGIAGARAGLGVLQLLGKWGMFEGGVGGFLMRASGLDVISTLMRATQSKIVGFVEFLFNPATGKVTGPIVDVMGKFGWLGKILGNLAVDGGFAAAGLTKLITGPLSWLLMLTGSSSGKPNLSGTEAWSSDKWARFIIANHIKQNGDVFKTPFGDVGATKEVLQALFKYRTQNLKFSSQKGGGDVHVHGNVIMQLPAGTRPEDAPAFLRSWARTQGAIKTNPRDAWLNFGHLVPQG